MLQWCHPWVHCCICLQLHSSFGRSLFENEQPHLSSSEGPEPAPLYDEVGAGLVNKLELNKNLSYELGARPVAALEMKRESLI